MNAKQFFKDNGTTLIIAAVAVLIAAYFWWDVRSNNLSASANQTWVEAPAPAPVITPAPVTGTPTPAPAPATGQYEWCAQINGLSGGHLPHLLNLGVNTSQGGQNWFSSRNATGAENWGVLNDGTYFIKKAIADQAAAQLGVSIVSFQVKTSENNWSQPKPGTLGTVGGQAAWVFK